MKNHIGIVGLGVMGSAIALNLKDKGYQVAIYNRSYEKTVRLVEENSDLVGYDKLDMMVKSLECPRKILIMVDAQGVDTTLQQLLEMVNIGDILIDGGNSFYLDTKRRMSECESKGIYFIGMGISGGEEGALKGPSLMPSGSYEAYKQIEKMLIHIAASYDHQACVSYIGPYGSGHFVKMMHNGIEYALMQLIVETYMTLKSYGKKEDEIVEIFEKWNQTYHSYLLSITCVILRYEDDSTLLVHKIKDRAAHKGTGTWSATSAIEMNEATPSLLAALQARFLSMKSKIDIPYSANFCFYDEIRDELEMSFYLTMLLIFHQGFDMMKKVSDEQKWDLDLVTMARIWQKGCIIQSSLLTQIMHSYTNGYSLLEDEKIISIFRGNQNIWRKRLADMIQMGVVAPVYFASLSYYDGLRQNSGMQLIQAMRDCFGAHGYERIDKEGIFTTKWKRN